MKKKIVSTLVVIGLLIVLGDTVTTFNIGRNRKLNILPLFSVLRADHWERRTI